MFNDIKKLLSRSVFRAGIGGQVRSVRILEIFSEAVEAALPEDGATGKVKPLYIKDNIIIAASLSRSVIDILTKEQEKIISEINKRVGEKAVKDIKYIG
ncbi:hypothetical protein A2303_03420 [Candidatus Falkowbacteria bacterium RIFOXYB2_FULL_47_14]|uniref:DUF721 domain-containing protein n=1 Tax=Candidatus Falkowbacteria bacterium RIFOXYA2_FULL_47_19 TaxID=1797994 RepID=A0A1F5SHV9_9BACT|nr:MAG: hypothetical protein A2227_02970 [Candidatus Falkowbacteria bacterium RIFOXYA2_FULL_47_19]OGF36723.1 MAG: hypothetical protein A2468_02805 [Candidatus Falkowbacteria bacterium RIFOXYC2_FULL_46_15]OGF42450.1 MAG: hypothetical protein A2303_03420 [Candidatus Falkowbacteria bacterium RIFOXYB2_FULL_47_14]